MLVAEDRESGGCNKFVNMHFINSTRLSFKTIQALE